MNELLDLVQVGLDVAKDEHVGSIVDGDGSARRQHLLGPGLHFVGLRVGNGNQAGDDRRELELLPPPSDRHLALRLEVGERRRPKEVSLTYQSEVFRLKHDLESLVPGDVSHSNGDGTRYV